MGQKTITHPWRYVSSPAFSTKINLETGIGMAVLLSIVCAFKEANFAITTKANGQYAFVMLYNIMYGFTWGPMPWLLPAEIFPLRSRSKGMALATTR